MENATHSICLMTKWRLCTIIEQYMKCPAYAMKLGTFPNLILRLTLLTKHHEQSFLHASSLHISSSVCEKCWCSCMSSNYIPASWVLNKTHAAWM